MPMILEGTHFTEDERNENLKELGINLDQRRLTASSVKICLSTLLAEVFRYNKSSDVDIKNRDPNLKKLYYSPSMIAKNYVLGATLMKRLSKLTGYDLPAWTTMIDCVDSRKLLPLIDFLIYMKGLQQYLFQYISDEWNSDSELMAKIGFTNNEKQKKLEELKSSTSIERINEKKRAIEKAELTLKTECQRLQIDPKELELLIKNHKRAQGLEQDIQVIKSELSKIDRECDGIVTKIFGSSLQPYSIDKKLSDIEYDLDILKKVSGIDAEKNQAKSDLEKVKVDLALVDSKIERLLGERKQIGLTHDSLLKQAQNELKLAMTESMVLEKDIDQQFAKAKNVCKIDTSISDHSKILEMAREKFKIKFIARRQEDKKEFRKFLFNNAKAMLAQTQRMKDIKSAYTEKFAKLERICDLINQNFANSKNDHDSNTIPLDSKDEHDENAKPHDTNLL